MAERPGPDGQDSKFTNPVDGVRPDGAEGPAPLAEDPQFVAQFEAATGEVSQDDLQALVAKFNAEERRPGGTRDAKPDAPATPEQSADEPTVWERIGVSEPPKDGDAAANSTWLEGVLSASRNQSDPELSKAAVVQAAELMYSDEFPVSGSLSFRLALTRAANSLGVNDEVAAASSRRHVDTASEDHSTSNAATPGIIERAAGRVQETAGRISRRRGERRNNLNSVGNAARAEEQAYAEAKEREDAAVLAQNPNAILDRQQAETAAYAEATQRENAEIKAAHPEVVTDPEIARQQANREQAARRAVEEAHAREARLSPNNEATWDVAHRENERRSSPLAPLKPGSRDAVEVRPGEEGRVADVNRAMEEAFRMDREAADLNALAAEYRMQREIISVEGNGSLKNGLTTPHVERDGMLKDLEAEYAAAVQAVRERYTKYSKEAVATTAKLTAARAAHQDFEVSLLSGKSGDLADKAWMTRRALGIPDDAKPARQYGRERGYGGPFHGRRGRGARMVQRVYDVPGGGYLVECVKASTGELVRQTVINSGREPMRFGYFRAPFTGTALEAKLKSLRQADLRRERPANLGEYFGLRFGPQLPQRSRFNAFDISETPAWDAQLGGGQYNRPRRVPWYLRLFVPGTQ